MPDSRTLASRGTTMLGHMVARIVGAEGLMGFEVLDSQGERVGELRDIMLDLRVGRVVYGVLALRGAARSSEHLVVVPWNALHMSVDGDCLHIHTTRERVQRGPSVQPDAMPTLLDHELATSIHAYFGTKPYWERERAAQQS